LPARRGFGASLIRVAGFTADPAPAGIDALFGRLWHTNPDNMHMLASVQFGPLMIGMGLEASRCCLEHAIADLRAHRPISIAPARHGFSGKIAALLRL
jgi:hypothetical protein